MSGEQKGMLSGRYFQARQSGDGTLQCGVFAVNEGMPVENAKISVFEKGTDKKIEELISNDSGQTAELDLTAPPKEYAQEENQPKPYAEYDLVVEAAGFRPTKIDNVQIFSGAKAIQDVDMIPIVDEKATMARQLPQEQIIVIQENTLWGEYAPKIPEDDVKPLPVETGFVVLDKLVVPEYIIVHDGLPTNTAAKNYYVKYKDYIKNVASSEIYATWPEAAITANVLAIISFTLNRVFTEWYRAKGKNFTITNSTAYDHAFFYGRNIYQEISVVVDEIFATYVTKPSIRQPLFTQYCDGKKVSCPGWMTQWGCKYMADKGSSALQILRSFYGSDIYLGIAEKVSGVPSSFPGSPLQVGSKGKDVRTIQSQLNSISKNYPAIPKIRADGIFGNGTRQAVQTFQGVFYLPQTGIVDYPTWYKISDVYVAVTKMAELL